MIGKKKLFDRLERILTQSGADQTEIVYVGNESGLTRYANSYIHQNVAESNCQILFRSIEGKRVGVASTNSMALADLKKTLADSLDIARQQPEKPNFPGLPKPARYKDLKTFDEKTAKFTPRDRAISVKRVIAEASRKKFTMAGSFATSCGEIAVVNSLGVRAYQPVTSASINMIAMSDTSSGYASGTSRNVADIDVTSLAKVAVDKCDRSQNPREMETGEYEVLLEPAAIAEMLEWINYVGLGSKPFEQNTSFLSGKIGRKITSDRITIYDNGLDDRSMAFPFDFEGVPKKKVVYIDKGVAKGVVHDRASALKAGTKSTGHALTANENDEGALGFNIFIAPGKTRREKMVAGIKRGILVTRFHYINGLIDTRNSVLTGMTRDGTFLVENGEIVCGLKNLRFTDSFTRAFKSVQAISKETQRVESWWSAVGCMTVPAVHLGSFKFSGKTEF
ncbi:MAG: TldD/PmbA family protein [candidate division Zixibacteria bacterium]|nr:TldD/PmbA family protein [candidate division Zixibacteria bacterium]